MPDAVKRALICDSAVGVICEAHMLPMRHCETGLPIITPTSFR